MTTREPIERRIAPLIAAQAGVFSRDQALQEGCTKSTIRRRISSGRWEEVHLGVYRIAGAPASWRQALTAARLAWGDGAVISHRAAAALWKFPGFEPGPVELIVPRDRRRTVEGSVAHWLPTPGPGDVTKIGGSPVTTATRTLIDIGSVVPRSMVEEALDDALRRGLVSVQRLRWRLSDARRLRGVAVVRSLLDDRDPGSAVPESVFETRLLRTLKDSRLPAPVLQHEVRYDGRVVAVIDFAFPRCRLAIEAEGYRWHSGRTRWAHDLRRRNMLGALGWRVIHVTWSDLTTRPAEVMGEIQAAISARGCL